MRRVACTSATASCLNSEAKAQRSPRLIAHPSTFISESGPNYEGPRRQEALPCCRRHHFRVQDRCSKQKADGVVHVQKVCHHTTFSCPSPPQSTMLQAKDRHSPSQTHRGDQAGSAHTITAQALLSHQGGRVWSTVLVLDGAKGPVTEHRWTCE